MRTTPNLIAAAFTAPMLLLPMLVIPMAASAAPLDVKTGQWEITSVMHIDGGFMDPEAMAKLPPQAQQQLQAVMQGMTKPHTAKSCVTDDDLSHGLNFTKKMGPQCQRTVQNVTVNGMEVTTECKMPDGTSSTIQAKFTAADRATLQGLVDINRTSPRGPKHMTVNIDGKWLASACDGTEVNAPAPTPPAAH